VTIRRNLIVSAARWMVAADEIQSHLKWRLGKMLTDDEYREAASMARAVAHRSLLARDRRLHDALEEIVKGIEVVDG